MYMYYLWVCSTEKMLFGAPGQPGMTHSLRKPKKPCGLMINDGLKNRTRETFDLLNLRKPCEEDGSCIFGAWRTKKTWAARGYLDNMYMSIFYINSTKIRIDMGCGFVFCKIVECMRPLLHPAKKCTFKLLFSAMASTWCHWCNSNVSAKDVLHIFRSSIVWTLPTRNYCVVSAAKSR